MEERDRGEEYAGDRKFTEKPGLQRFSLPSKLPLADAALYTPTQAQFPVLPPLTEALSHHSLFSAMDRNQRTDNSEHFWAEKCNLLF